MSNYVLETWELSKQYNGQAGCRNITLQVPRGSVFGFLGQNGAGKSTFVRTMMGLLKPSSGKAVMLGHPIGSVESRRRVGYLPELFRYPDWLTGRQLLEAHADLSGLYGQERKAAIHRLIDRVGLTGRADEKIRGYSKGMQQRIGLACALISDPELVFLDEPTSALDPIGRREVRELIVELRNQGKTVFLNSHLLSEVESICDYVAIIHRGELVVQGDWRKLTEVQPQVEIVLELVPDGMWEGMPDIVLHAERLSQREGTESWLVTVKDQNNVPALIQALVARGAAIHEVIRKRQSLEDAFLYWVNRKERELSCGRS
ncbi:ABC transporter ATP-binding protein [Brevibacillus sp. H7]|uniref:ABC transporter ATP-binding protein n=1 Tax=Brevibacillus sp. H7 TaxID=3349138 RepID=UPI0038268B81